MSYFKAFLAGFLSTLVFHQGLLSILHDVGTTARSAYAMEPTTPFGVPAVLSLAFWGGVWGILLWLAIRPFVGSPAYWILAIAVGAVVPSLVELFVFPAKGQAVADGWRPEILIGTLVMNGAWGFGVALAMRFLHSTVGAADRD